MEIKLISKTPNYLKTCWTAARTCYSADSPIELLAEEKTEEEMLRLLERIMTSKHLSVVEHCSMTFAVKDVSRTLLAQYSRHRIGVSLSVQSQRYVSEQSSKQAGGLFGHVVPQTIMENGEAHVRYMDCMKAIQAAYDDLLTSALPNRMHGLSCRAARARISSRRSICVPSWTSTKNASKHRAHSGKSKI